MKKDVKGGGPLSRFCHKTPFSEMGMPAGCGKEASMVDEKKRRRRGTTREISIVCANKANKACQKTGRLESTA